MDRIEIANHNAILGIKMSGVNEINLSAIGARLEEERFRIGYPTLVEMAARMGVTTKTQSRYERGGTMPDAGYLAVMDSEGADILYIVTGRRGGSPAPLLAEDETLALSLFRRLDGKGRELALSLMRGYQAPPKNVSISVGGDVGQVIKADQVNQAGASIKVVSRRGGKKS